MSKILDDFNKVPPKKNLKKAVDFLQSINIRHRTNLTFPIALVSALFLEYMSPGFHLESLAIWWLICFLSPFILGLIVKLLLMLLLSLIKKGLGKNSSLEKLDTFSVILLISILICFISFLGAIIVFFT